MRAVGGAEAAGRRWAKYWERSTGGRSTRSRPRAQSSRASESTSPLSLPDDRMQAPAPAVDQGAVRHDPGVHMVDVESGRDSRLDQRHLLGAHGVLAPEVVVGPLANPGAPERPRSGGRWPGVRGSSPGPSGRSWHRVGEVAQAFRRVPDMSTCQAQRGRPPIVARGCLGPLGSQPNGHAANSRICCRLREEVAGGQGSAVKDGQSPDLHLGFEGVQTGPGTDRSPSGTVRRGASSL